MAYIPLNKIVTDLYSRNNDLVYKTTNDVYVGPYYKTYKNQYFTGKTPNDGPNQELIFVEDTLTGYIIKQPQSRIAFTDAPTIFNDISTPGYNQTMVVDYSLLNDVDLNKSTYKNLPNQFYPIPTDDDYKLGSFTRYFCVKSNENSYLEINKDTYKSLRGKFKGWDWVNYIAFKIPWTLTGVEKEVQQVNYNITTLQEKRNSKPGFKLFLKYNYTKFYQPPPQDVNTPLTSSLNPPSPPPLSQNRVKTY